MILMNIKLSVFPLGAIPGENVFIFHEKEWQEPFTYFAQNKKMY
jgi:hypothetical protein